MRAMARLDPAEQVNQLARQSGFDRVGIARAGPVGRRSFLEDWLRCGYAGQMQYLHRYLPERSDPRLLLPGAKSIIVVAMNYYQPAPSPDEQSGAFGRVAMYAWGQDYHKVVRAKLLTLVQRMRQTVEEPFEARVCVDTAPVLEREWAAAAGVGWIGKNTMVLHQQIGSFSVLGELLTTLELATDEPVADRCGKCTRCLDACPTQAFPAPHVLDASRCVSYLTIELREAIPLELRASVGDWLFGCDVCQQVCPYNRKAPQCSQPELRLRPPAPRVDLIDLLTWSSDDYRAKLGGSAIRRAKLWMLKRNAAVALGNLSAVTVLVPLYHEGARRELELVLEHVRWAQAQQDRTLGKQ